jgi:hypothetical protein
MLGDESARSLSASAACIELAQKTGELLLVNMAHGFHAWAASRLGDHAAAHASLTIHDETARQLGGQFVLPEQFAAMRAEVALNAGEYERAVTLSQEAIRLAEPLGGIFGQGLSERVWGQALSSLDPPLPDEAGTHLAASLRAFESGACVVEAARTHVAWGRLCQARWESDASREHFEKAAAQFQLSEMTRELEQTKHLIGSLSA